MYFRVDKRIDRTLAQQLFNEVKVICWILTNSTNHMKKAIHVKNTWGSRCNKLIFMSDKEGKTKTLFVLCKVL